MHAHTHITLSERIFRARIIPTQERDVIFKWFSSLLLSHHFFYYLRSLHSPIHDVSLSSFVMTPSCGLFSHCCLLAYFCSCLFVCCPFPCVFVVFQCPVCVFMVFRFFSAVLLSKMEWWRSLYTIVTFSRMLYHSDVLFWMSIFPYCVFYYISAVNLEVRELKRLTQTLCCMCAFRWAVNGFPLSLRRCFQFPCLLHTNLFNGSFLNVHMIGWIKLQRWN